MDSVAGNLNGLNRNKEGVLSRIFNLFEIRDNKQDKAFTFNDCNSELLNEIKAAKTDWESANQNFEFANDEEMIDYYTYKIKACQVRYEYFIKQAKQNQAN